MRVLVRASLNEPINSGVVVNDFRLRKMIPLITLLREAGARTLLIGHLSGDPKKNTLLPVAEYFQKQFPVTFVNDILGKGTNDVISRMQDGDVVMFENLRKHSEEKKNDENFAHTLANLADIYINESFPSSHRSHASIIGVPRFLPSYIGLQFEQEFSHLSQALNPPHPSLIVIGGAKPKTKVPLALQFLEVADKVFVGGLSGNEFFVAKGYLLESEISTDSDIDVNKYLNHPRLMLPEDILVVSSDGTVSVKEPAQIEVGEQVIDVGPKTLSSLSRLISKSSFLVWNGPLGDTDREFFEGTKYLANAISQYDIPSVIGGGDTVAALESFDFKKKNIFLSTAGAAMIDFLANGTLVGIEALQKTSN